MRFLIVNSHYPAFLDWFYARHPGLPDQCYAVQLDAQNASLFGVSDFFPRNLNALGHTANELHINNCHLQAAWAREHAIPFVNGFRYCVKLRRGFVPWVRRESSTKWMCDVLAAQIEHFRPDVILSHVIDGIHPHFWTRMSRHYKLLVGQIAAPLARRTDLRPFDLLLSSLPNYVQRFQQAGRQSKLYRLAFDPKVLEELGDVQASIDVSFVGSLSPAHRGRIRWLEHLCRRVDVNVWGYGYDQLSKNSPIRKCYRGTAWGVDMYRIIRHSRMTLNFHIGIAECYANNMRLYEATGAGTLLVTDHKQNLTDMFEPGHEVVAYQTYDDCLDRIHYYLNHESERQKIAAGGQARTLREHTYGIRMQELVEIVERYL